MRRIPATIVTGFLGAGKTSLVRHLLAAGAGHRLAVIVNEFGALGIDRDLLLGCGDATCRDDDIVELANGCLCCTVADEFVPALDLILAKNPKIEHIVIETSGLALPKPLVQASGLRSTALQPRLQLARQRSGVTVTPVFSAARIVASASAVPGRG